MAKNTLTLAFDGYEMLQGKLKELGGDVRTATEKALKQSAEIIESNVSAAIIPHNQTHETEQSIIQNHEVEWTDTTAEVRVGFDIKTGGLPSIFLMYGTQLHGQPCIAPDKKLYDAVYGKQTKKQIKKLQKQVLDTAIEEAMGE